MAFKEFDIKSHLPSGLASTLGGGTFAPRGIVGFDGVQEVEKNILAMNKAMVTQSTNSQKKLAEQLLEMGRNFVPYDSGDLFSTGKVTQKKPLGPYSVSEFIVSFGGLSDNADNIDYAMLVHENPEGHDFNKHPERWPAGYPGPKQSHYLSTPFEILKPQMRNTVADAVQSAVMDAIMKAKASKAASMRPRLVKRS